MNRKPISAASELDVAPAPRRRKKARPHTEQMPILPLRQVVLFPFTMSSLIIDTPRGNRLVENVVPKNRLVALVPVVKRDGEPEQLADFFGWGCVGRIVKVLRFPDETLRVLVRGISRVQLNSVDQIEPFFRGTVTAIDSPAEKDIEIEAMSRNLLTQFQEMIAISPTLPDEIKVALLNIDDTGRIADLIANTISLSFEEKLDILQTADLRTRLGKLAVFLNRESQMLKLGHEIQSKVNSTFSKNQREAYLREQLRVIQEQLGDEPDTPEVAELRKKVAAANLPTDAKEVAERELERLRRMHPANADYHVSRTYIEWLLALPWNKVSEDRLDVTQAAQILNADHFGLDKIKDRILEFLAVRQLKKDARGPILCLVGPPGVGKTSLGQSIARALGREFVRVSLGGTRDEAEIRGHRRTYVGALPGRIIQGIRRAKTANPVFMLDELDKIGADFRGDPAAALLEALDPQQNHAFSDHYLEVPFDLSRVLFIATANLVDPILSALKDRLEILRLPGYTAVEKREIALRFLLPRQLEANGLTAKQLCLPPATLDALIACYTCEAGVRNLEREIGTVCRKAARRFVEKKVRIGRKLTVTPADLADSLGPQKLFPETAAATPLTGVATGLAWTSAGGEILQVEVTTLPGKGLLTLTGSLGDVMKESAQIAFSFVRSRHADLGFDPAALEKLDVHIHVPAGATPKDGPSAGITIATALASHLTGRPVKPFLAMTGELSLRGRILPVGGIKEKVLAAVRAGVTTIFLPAKNRCDWEEIPVETRRLIHFRFQEDGLATVRAALFAAPGRRPAHPQA